MRLEALQRDKINILRPQRAAPFGVDGADADAVAPAEHKAAHRVRVRVAAKGEVERVGARAVVNSGGDELKRSGVARGGDGPDGVAQRRVAPRALAEPRQTSLLLAN